MQEQRSDGWYSARLGLVTGSRVADVLTGTAEKRKAYMMQLAAERLTGVPQDNIYITAAMQRGIDLEDTARMLFSLETEIGISETGFWIDEELKGWGASPDGITSDGGIIEIKCPNTITHLGYYKDKKLPAKYKPQVMCQLAITGREHAYFCSYDDRLPEHLQLFFCRVERDEDYIAVMRKKVEVFLNELEDLVCELL